jgi:hypothetical protein
MCPLMPLTDIAIKALKPITTARKITDDKGLYLEVMPMLRQLRRCFQRI